MVYCLISECQATLSQVCALFPTVQVCTGVMLHGYGFVRQLCAELQDFMRQHDFKSIAEFKGKFVMMGVMS